MSVRIIQLLENHAFIQLENTARKKTLFAFHHNCCDSQIESKVTHNSAKTQKKCHKNIEVITIERLSPQMPSAPFPPQIPQKTPQLAAESSKKSHIPL